LCKVFNSSGAVEASQAENEGGDEMRVYDKETYIDKYLRKWRRKLKRGPRYRITQGYDIQK